MNRYKYGSTTDYPGGDLLFFRCLVPWIYRLFAVFAAYLTECIQNDYFCTYSCNALYGRCHRWYHLDIFMYTCLLQMLIYTTWIWYSPATFEDLGLVYNIGTFQLKVCVNIVRCVAKTQKTFDALNTLNTFTPAEMNDRRSAYRRCDRKQNVSHLSLKWKPFSRILTTRWINGKDIKQPRNHWHFEGCRFFLLNAHCCSHRSNHSTCVCKKNFVIHHMISLF